MAFRSMQVDHDISETAWSESAQNFMRDCIQKCTSDNKKCKLKETLLPTRVIEVGNVDGEQLRLFETQGSGAVGQYAALSYCWGNDQPLKTTSANIRDMTAGKLLFSQLPQTLADAVHVTRSLGIQYLWIDALCIIQDSIDDWEKESAEMSTIYENAYLVIAASSSASATQGFLSHQRQQSQLFTLCSDNGLRTVLAVRSPVRSGFHSDMDSKRVDPLAERAWAFQEQHMSTRCLIFSKDELQWVCETGQTCEHIRSMRSSLPMKPFDHHPFLAAHCDDTRQTMASLGSTFQDAWWRAVSEYSGRKLTLADDKLPAFAGFAKMFGARIRSRYIAGLWEANIVQDLLWRRLAPPGFASLPKDYRAPSFSWASINEKVYYEPPNPRNTWISHSFVLDVGSVVPGRNPFGKVSDAWITIRGPMVRGSIEFGPDFGQEPNPKFRCDDQEIDSASTIWIDSAVGGFSYAGQDNTQEISVRRCDPDDEGRRRYDSSKPAHPSRAQEPTQSNPGRASVWLLHLGRYTTGLPEDEPYSDDEYLVLGTSPRDTSKYERIGYCRGCRIQPLVEQTLTII
ncbi:hypothetical protein Daus18300_001474 [Diaporthe australafricana]|uniref:Heterokaryon incompatibility domain-containing protein n=1 Tax=Diaporthe australafricana TaxID=127596 RepID=A0ABR3XVT8_9PEZI